MGAESQSGQKKNILRGELLPADYTSTFGRMAKISLKP